MRIRFIPLGLCLATTATIAAVSAQVAKKPLPAAPRAPAAPAATQNGNVILRGSNSVYDDQTGIGKLNGNVTVTQTGEDVILYAQSLVYNRPKNQAVATGQLRIETRNSTIRGANLFADFDTKIATITGNVVVTTHGKTDGINGNRQDFRAEFKSKPSKIFCDRVDWDYEDKQATLTGNIRMTQGENSGTCERILYDEEKNVARLQGSVRFTDKQNRTFRTTDLTVYIDEGRVAINAPSNWTMPAQKTAPSATPRATKPAKFAVPPAPNIDNSDLQVFNVTPAPIPTPRPEPTEAPAPTPPPEPEEPVTP